MAELMTVREHKVYRVRCVIEEPDCKQLLRFESRSVDFLAAEFLLEKALKVVLFLEDKRWKYFCDLLAILDYSLALLKTWCSSKYCL